MNTDIELGDALKKSGFSEEECLEILKESKEKFIIFFGDSKDIFKRILAYYDSEINRIEKQRDESIAKLNNLWEVY